jgi:hypothetical protein
MKKFLTNAGSKREPSKLRNFFSVLGGVFVGLYFGQYFPDLYYGKIDPYVIDLKSK